MCYYDVDVCNLWRFGILFSGSPANQHNIQYEYLYRRTIFAATTTAID